MSVAILRSTLLWGVLLLAQATSAWAEPIPIAVARVTNHAEGLEAALSRTSAQLQAMAPTLQRDTMEFAQQMMVYQGEITEWTLRAEQEGLDAAGPRPVPPELQLSTPYVATIADPIAGGVRDLFVHALAESEAFDVLERTALNELGAEQTWAAGGTGTSVDLPEGLQGARFLVLASITDLTVDAGGGGLGAALDGLLSSAANLPVSDVNVGINWKSASASMEVRLVDVATSRVVAVTRVVGKAGSVGVDASGSADLAGGALPASLGGWANTPMERALRRMVRKAVADLERDAAAQEG